MIFREPEEQLLGLANSCPPTTLHPQEGLEVFVQEIQAGLSDLPG